jgi:hypothetical protein
MMMMMMTTNQREHVLPFSEKRPACYSQRWPERLAFRKCDDSLSAEITTTQSTTEIRFSGAQYQHFGAASLVENRLAAEAQTNHRLAL